SARRRASSWTAASSTPPKSSYSSSTRRSSRAHSAATISSTLRAACTAPLTEEDIVAASGDHDLARLFQQPDLRHDPRLRRLHVAHPDRAHEVHLLAQRLDRTVRHRPHDPLAQLLAGRLERQRELLGVHLAQEPLHRTIVEADDVL